MDGTLAIVCLISFGLVSGGPIGAIYFATTNAAIMSSESGLPTSTIYDGFSIKMEDADRSEQFAVAIRKQGDLMLKIQITKSPKSRQCLIMTVTSPVTGNSVNKKIMLYTINNGGSVFAEESSTGEVQLGMIINFVTDIKISSNGSLSTFPIRSGTVAFPIYDHCADFDSTHCVVLVNLVSENLAPGSVVTFSGDVKFLTKTRPTTTVPTTTALTSTSSAQPNSKNAPPPESDGSVQTTETVAKAGGQWSIAVVVIVILVVIVLVVAGVIIGNVCYQKKQASAKNNPGASGASVEPQKVDSGV
uniref:Lysosome-associated membrane glycoprotein 2-like n=1 Tax=Panagrellus redivivus TaxID=6233 RepID=A0A7E4W8I4_PANRE